MESLNLDRSEFKFWARPPTSSETLGKFLSLSKFQSPTCELGPYIFHWLDVKVKCM